MPPMLLVTPPAALAAQLRRAPRACAALTHAPAPRLRCRGRRGCAPARASAEDAAFFAEVPAAPARAPASARLEGNPLRPNETVAEAQARRLRETAGVEARSTVRAPRRGCRRPARRAAPR